MTKHSPDIPRLYAFQQVLWLVLQQKQGRENQGGLSRPGDEPGTSEVNSEVMVLDVSEHRPRRAPSKTCRELTRKACARAGGYPGSGPPLSYPRCVHEMKIICLNDDPKLMEQIFRHPGLWRQHPDPDQGKTKAPVDGPVVLDDFEDGWPGYEGPVLVHP